MILHRNEPEEEDSGLPKLRGGPGSSSPQDPDRHWHIFTAKTRELQMSHRGSPASLKDFRRRVLIPGLPLQ